MKKTRASITQAGRSPKSPIVWVGIGIAAGALLFPPGIALAEAAKEVLVTNDASNPIPVAAQGTTTVAGAVDVGNTVPVIGGGEPVVIRLTDACVVPPSASYAVPAGKRLVVEDVNGRYGVPQGQRRRPVLFINSEAFDLPQTFAFTDAPATDAYVMHESLRTYAEEGSSVRAFIDGCGGASDGAMTLLVSGYLVDAS